MTTLNIATLEGDGYELLGKSSFIRKLGKVAKKGVMVATAPVRIPLRVTARFASPVLNPLQRTAKRTPVLRTFDSALSATYNLSTGRTEKSFRQVKRTGTNVGNDAQAVGHVSLVIARKVLFPIVQAFVTANPTMSKTATKVALVPPATAAVTASAGAAPAAPLVPVLLPPIIDSVFNALKDRLSFRKTLSDPTMPGMNEGFDPGKGMPMSTPEAEAPAEEPKTGPSWVLPAALGLGGVFLIMAMKKKK